jgi:hypothetical protein
VALRVGLGDDGQELARPALHQLEREPHYYARHTGAGDVGGRFFRRTDGKPRSQIHTNHRESRRSRVGGPTRLLDKRSFSQSAVPRRRTYRGRPRPTKAGETASALWASIAGVKRAAHSAWT